MSKNDWIEELISSGEYEDDQGDFCVDEFKDVVISLRMLHAALRDIPADSSNWKPAILACHSALQGACVCILTRTDGTGALAEKSEKQLMDKLYGESDKGRNFDDDSIDWPEEFIASLPALLKRLPAPLSVNLPRRGAKTYPWDKSGDLRRLHEFRNKLSHFPPVGWRLGVSGLPRILLCAISLVEEITQSREYKRYNRFLDMDLASLFEEIRKNLHQIDRSLNP